MKVPQAIKSYQDYHRINSKKNTLKNYDFLFTRFSDGFSDRELESITSDDILRFLTRLTNGTKQTTKRNRYSSLKAFFLQCHSGVRFYNQLISCLKSNVITHNCINILVGTAAAKFLTH